MNLMFWKKKATTEDSADDSQEKPGDKTASGKSPGREPQYQEKSEGTHGEAANAGPPHQKSRLIIAAATGLLILAAIGLAAWKVSLSSQDQNSATVVASASGRPMALPEKQLIKLPKIEFLPLRKAPSKDRQTDNEALKKRINELHAQIEALKIESSQVESSQSISRQAEIETLKKIIDELQAQNEELKAELPQIEKAQTEQHQADIDALTKKNSELQAQIEALKNKQRRPSVSPASRPDRKAQPPARSGELAIDSRNPKSTAMTLKEAIEAMNAGSDDPAKTNAK